MVQEILDTLKIQPGETGFDATLGYGGHTKAMLACLNGQGHIYATDVDPEESAKTKKRLEELGYGEDILTIRLQNFCTIDEIAKEAGGFDFILADLGVSSMQIDNPKRGFSFKVDGPLDLRLNQEAGISAAERLDTITREELAGMLYENSDEPYCEELAKAITDEIRKGSRIDTTTKLREVIEKTLDFLPEKEKKDTIKKTCQRTFQALRIDVNREFEVLYEFMEKLPDALKPGGRVAILTFHSGEDKLVKKALKEGYRAGIYADYSKDVVRPSADNLPLLRAAGFTVDLVQPCRAGYIDPAALVELLGDDVALVSIMVANNETGVVQPIRELAAAAHAAGALFHTDAIQGYLHIPLDVTELGVDAMTVAAHKIGGPVASGALYLKNRTPLRPRIFGGGQEAGRRAGTQDLRTQLAFAAAASVLLPNVGRERATLQALSDKLYATLTAHPRIHATMGDYAQADRLPGMVSIYVDGMDSEELIIKLDAAGFEVSAGSACSSGNMDPSHVLSAMGIGREKALGALRISFDDRVNPGDLDDFAQTLLSIVGAA